MKMDQNGEKERTQDIRVSQRITFESLLLSSNTLAGLKSAGFYRPSPIQLQGIPLGKCGFDLLLEAKSGTGKTAVFTIIALEKLDFEKGLQAIMLAPTREIAVQICEVIQQLGVGYEGLKTMSVIGGMPVQEDILKIKCNNIHIIVGSPGRLRHLIQDKHLNISAVRLLVLDEADKLMEKSFLADVNYIFSVLPKQKQIIMSSATYSDSSKVFIEQYMQNAQHVCPENNSVLLGVKQTITIVKHNTNVVKQTQYRFEELLKILSQKQFKQCLIFCNYQTRVVELKKKLNKEKWPAEHLYGQQDQSDRLDALKMLQEYKCRILISTDLAARGIDATNVDLVINFEPPAEWQTYLHRIGRAGRFGSYGIAVTIVSEGKEQKSFQLILDSLQVPVDHFWHKIDDTDFLVPQTLTTKQSDNSLPFNCIKDKSLKKIWQCLVVDIVKDQQKTESFEDLCKSFCGFENQEKFESFTGLLNSFQNHQTESNEIETKTVELDSIPERIKVLKEYLGLNNEVKPTILDGSNLNEETGLLNVNEDKPGVINNSNIELVTEKLEFHNTEPHTSRHETLQNSNCDLQNENSTLTEDEIALLNAGLPTSFGKPSKKFSKIYNGAVKKKEFKHQWIPKHKTNYEFVEQKELLQTSDDQNPTSVHQTYTCSTNSSSSDSGFRHNSRDYLQSSYNNIKSRNNEKKQSYTNWYNELKQRVREIEYAVYIHTMSTL